MAVAGDNKINIPIKDDGIDARSVRINQLDSVNTNSHIIFGASGEYFARWAGSLSLKTFNGGRAFYNTGLGHYAVDADHFLVLNEMQPYSITIDSDREVESFCIFFETGFAEDVYQSLITQAGKLLDDPQKAPNRRIDFVQRLYRRAALDRVLFDLKSAVEQKLADQFWFRERLHETMQLLLLERENTFKEITRLPASRASTREELYKRIYRARDFIASAYDQAITLEEIAKVACLSPNHLLRTFRSVFGRTPHQYLTDLRLKEAKKLLEKEDLKVIEICHSVGFESHSSFSLLFRRRFGTSPEEYRRRKR